VPATRRNVVAQTIPRVAPPHARISQKVLTEQLRELMADGIVNQERTGRVPAPVVYSLTEYGRSVTPIAEAVRQWGRGHIEQFSESTETRAS
jgi:DNA-binding HxlR family transcriptional regulator